MLTQTAIRVTPPTSRSPRAAGREQHGSSDNNPLLESMHLMGAVLSYKRNTEIFGEDEPADYIYKVIRGSVRTYKILSDGRRQICGFYSARRLLRSAVQRRAHLSAEAIADAKILVVKRSMLTALADRDAAVGRELFALTTRELRRMHGTNPFAGEERAGARRELPRRNVGARCGRKRDRAAHVAPRYCRLSGADDRDRLAHTHVLGKLCCNRSADLASYRSARSVRLNRLHG